jgi:hypothetical protein
VLSVVKQTLMLSRSQLPHSVCMAYQYHHTGFCVHLVCRSLLWPLPMLRSCRGSGRSELVTLVLRATHTLSTVFRCSCMPHQGAATYMF